MLNNPIQQIERLQDAYAGNPEGLQKRANVSKELIDLLAMQSLQADLQAAKRNQMMQMQGNPATVKDQLQQGLMGEYRQQAAKELGAGPSEMDVVARAQQGMPRGGPQQQQQQQQQQQPPMAGGLQGQMGPIQLAGGGIVAFDAGSEDKGPIRSEFSEGLESVFGEDENIFAVTEGLMGLREEASDQPGVFSPSTPEQRNIRDRLSVGSDRARDLAFEIAENPELLAEYNKLGPREFALKYIDPETRGVDAGLATQTIKKREAAEQGLEGLAATDLTELAAVEADKLAKEKQRGEASAAQDQGIAAVGAGETGAAQDQGIAGVKPPLSYEQQMINVLENRGGLADVQPYTPDPAIRAALVERMNRDPEAIAKARAEMVATQLGKTEGIRKLEDRRERAEKLYEERSDEGRVKRGRFMAQLIGLAGGRAGSGARARGEYNKEQEALRDKFEKELNDIDTATIELTRSIGASAAQSYDSAMKDALTVQSTALGALKDMDASQRQDYIARLQLKAGDRDAQLKVLSSLSTAEQAAATIALGYEQLRGQNINAARDGAQSTLNKMAVEIQKANDGIDTRYQYELQQLEGSDRPKDVQALEDLKKKIALEKTEATVMFQDIHQKTEKLLRDIEVRAAKQDARIGQERVTGDTDYDQYEVK